MRYGVQGSGSTQTRDVPGGDTRHTTIAGLHPSTTYSIQVAAVNSAGIGVYSDPPVIIETLPSKYTSVFVDVLEKMLSVCSLFSPDLAVIKALI